MHEIRLSTSISAGKEIKDIGVKLNWDRIHLFGMKFGMASDILKYIATMERGRIVVCES